MLSGEASPKLLDVSTTATPSPKEATAMITRTTQPVRFHGWTLPKGSEVTVEAITVGLPGVQGGNARVTSPLSEWSLGLPTYALPADVWDHVPVERYDDATGRTVPV